MIYEQIDILDGNAHILGNWEYEDGKLAVQAVLYIPDQPACVYKEWTRKAMGHFDPDSMAPTTPDTRLYIIARKFEKMGWERFKTRYQTLIKTRPSFELP